MTNLMTIHYPWLWGWTENSSPSRSGEQVREAPTSSRGSLCWSSWDALSTYFWPSTSTLEASHLSSLQIWFPKVIWIRMNLSPVGHWWNHCSGGEIKSQWYMKADHLLYLEFAYIQVAMLFQFQTGPWRVRKVWKPHPFWCVK